MSRLLLILAMAVTIAGCGSPGQQASQVPVVTALEVVPVQSGVIVRSITLPAQVLARRQATLHARVAGYLRSIAVDKGDRVNAGAVLAQVEVPELEAARARQQAELTAAESEYQRLRESQSRAPDLVVPLAVDQARGRYEVAKATLQQSDTMLAYARITAPFAGVVTQRFVDPGALIPASSSGSAAGAAVVTLMDFSSIRLQIAVPEIESGHIAVGQSVQVTTDDLPGESFEGAVERFAYALDPATRTMLTEAIFPNPQLRLRPGMLVTAKLGIQRKDAALLLPVEAVVSDKSGTYLWALVDGKAERRAVKTGFNDGKQIELTEGMQIGEMVILAGKQALKEGQVVQTRPRA